LSIRSPARAATRRDKIAPKECPRRCTGLGRVDHGEDILDLALDRVLRAVFTVPSPSTVEGGHLEVGGKSARDLEPIVVATHGSVDEHHRRCSGGTRE
jgi:hypothetical protein